MFFVGGPNSRRDYHLEEGEEVVKFNSFKRNHTNIYYNFKVLWGIPIF